VEEEVAAVEDDEVDHRGPVKIGGVLWVVSHIPPLIVRESVSSLAHQMSCRSLRHQNSCRSLGHRNSCRSLGHRNVRTNSLEPRPIVILNPSTVLLFNPCR
jgi:hypothetical protein